MRNILLLAAILLSLTSCFKSEPKYKVGECLNPVDGSEVWKITSVKPLQGQLFNGNSWASQNTDIPDRIFTKIPCPDPK